MYLDFSVFNADVPGCSQYTANEHDGYKGYNEGCEVLLCRN